MRTGEAESLCVRREVKETRRGNEPSTTTTITSRILDRVYLCAGCMALGGEQGALRLSLYRHRERDLAVPGK
jgi:hypothetical protein